MIGVPVTSFSKFSSSSNGYIIAIDADDILLDELSFLQVIDENTTDAIEVLTTETDLEDLNELLFSTTVTSAYNFSSGILYIYLQTATYPYVSTTKVVPYGSRIGYPINSENDYIDVPNQHIELFIKYAIKEAAQLQGKLVPSSIEFDIKQLESNLGS